MEQLMGSKAGAQASVPGHPRGAGQCACQALVAHHGDLQAHLKK